MKANGYYDKWNGTFIDLKYTLPYKNTIIIYNNLRQKMTYS